MTTLYTGGLRPYPGYRPEHAALAVLMDCVASLGLDPAEVVPSRERARARFGWGRR